MVSDVIDRVVSDVIVKRVSDVIDRVVSDVIVKRVSDVIGEWLVTS